jgi:hypothetical protein
MECHDEQGYNRTCTGFDRASSSRFPQTASSDPPSFSGALDERQLATLVPHLDSDLATAGSECPGVVILNDHLAPIGINSLGANNCRCTQARQPNATTLDAPKHSKDDNDDQDGPEDTDTPVTVAITITAESAANAAKQENDEDDNEDSSERHDFFSL